MNQALKCLLVSNEKKHLDKLTRLLKTYQPLITIIGKANDEISMLKGIVNLDPDLIFLDVLLGSQNSFKILDRMQKTDFKIVFISDHHYHAIHGYNYNAIGFLLKPIALNQLDEIIKKEILLNQKIEQGQILHNNFENPHLSLYKIPIITVSDTQGLYVIQIPNILYCESNGNYTTIIIKNRKSITISKNLKYIESHLKSYNFIRIHRSYLINYNEVIGLRRQQGNFIIMSDKKSLPTKDEARKVLSKILNII